MIYIDLTALIMCMVIMNYMHKCIEMNDPQKMTYQYLTLIVFLDKLIKERGVL